MPRPRRPSHDMSTLRRGLEILNLLRESAWRQDVRGWGNNRIAEHLGADKSQVSRTLRVLVEEGLVTRDEQTRSYSLGVEAYSLGMRAADQHLMRASAYVVRKAVAALHCRAFVVVRQGTAAVTIWSDAPSDLRPIVASIGMAYPIISTQTGRALLFAHSPQQIRSIFGMDAPTSPRVEELITRVTRERQDGFAFDTLSDFGGGVAAVPVWVKGREVVAALGATGPDLDDPAKVLAAVRILMRASADLTQELSEETGAKVAESSVPYQGWPAPPDYRIDG